MATLDVARSATGSAAASRSRAVTSVPASANGPRPLVSAGVLARAVDQEHPGPRVPGRRPSRTRSPSPSITSLTLVVDTHSSSSCDLPSPQAPSTQLIGRLTSHDDGALRALALDAQVRSAIPPFRTWWRRRPGRRRAMSPRRGARLDVPVQDGAAPSNREPPRLVPSRRSCATDTSEPAGGGARRRSR